MSDSGSHPIPSPNKVQVQLLPLSQAIAIVRQCTEQIAALHRTGRIHGQIAWTESVEGAAQLLLSPAPTQRTLRYDGGDVARCPPELQDCDVLDLPTNIAAASEMLAGRGIDVAPCRIDVYQLGGLLCTLASGTGVAQYLRSAAAGRSLPAKLRETIDLALGFDPQRRYQSCNELARALKALQGESNDEQEPPQRVPVEAVQAMTDSHSQPVRLGGYRILERIGAGGMGDIYKAYDEALERHVAIKVLPAELARQADFVKRFRVEAAAVAKFVHPNIVPIYAIGEDAGQHFFVMQHICGESLDELLKRRKRLPLDETLAIVEQVLQGLSAAHARGLIHRDIKPANILLDRVLGRALIADFGLVKQVLDGPKQTITGVVLGTVDYLSPEQARGKGVDARSDLYSLGVMMYQMLAGRLPFEADSSAGMIFQHAYERPLTLARTAEHVPKRLGGLVMRLLAKEPRRRCQSAQEVLEEIAAYRAQESPPPVDLKPNMATARSESTRDRLLARLRQWSEQLARSLWAYAPAAVKPRQDTQQQVDGAVEEYERRCTELAALIGEAEGVAAEFAAQIASNRRAASQAARRGETDRNQASADLARQESAELERAAADLAEQLARHQRQLDGLRSSYAAATATLRQLRSQRDSLLARLRMLEASGQGLGTKIGLRSRRRWLLAVVSASCVAATVPVVIFLGRATQSNSTVPTQASITLHAAKVVPPLVVGARPTPLISPFSAQEAQRSQWEWARYLGLEAAVFNNSIGMSLVVAPPGEFTMGTSASETGHRSYDGPQHRVRLTRAFLASAYATTQDEFSAVMGFNPSHFSPAGKGKNYVRRLDTGRFPVESVTWYDSCVFCNELSRREGLEEFYVIRDRILSGNHVVKADVAIRGGLGYRLPTEAEFEYLARAGTTTPYWHGSVHDGKQGNALGTIPYGTSQPGVSLGRTCPVGQYPPNPFGMYDVDGNVGNWCWDWFSPSYYSTFRNVTAIDPLGPATGSRRTNRSNSYPYEPIYSRAGRRHSDLPSLIYECAGLRLVRFLE